jgi:hypothetical protein
MTVAELMPATPQARDQQERVNVLCIGSMSRSGSTVLDLMLGQLPGFYSGGELRYVWVKGLEQNLLCSCGERFAECPFWVAVGDASFGGWHNVDAAEACRTLQQVTRHRYLPLIVEPRLSRTFARNLDRFVELLAALHAGLQKVTGCSVIVDSSKDPPYLFMLRRVQNLDLRLVHLVRDPRGVAWSLQSKVARADTTGGFLPRKPPRTAALLWNDFNLMFHLLERGGMPRLFMRYEDVVKRPREHVERILSFVGADVDADALRFLEGDTVDLGGHHLIGGNPVRFRTKNLRLRVDDAWREKLGFGARSVVSLLTLPLLIRYGYSLSGSDRSGAIG